MSKQELTNRGAGVAKWAFPPVHPEGRKFGLIAGAVTSYFAFMAWETLAWPMAAITAWTLAFFRDPARTTPRMIALLSHLPMACHLDRNCTAAARIARP